MFSSSSYLRVSASLREYLFTALEPADPRDEAHQGMIKKVTFAHRRPGKM